MHVQKNAEYDASLRNKSGTKFVRHRNVSRENIVLYDVGVFAVKLGETHNTPAATAVSITLESLKRLAMVDATFVVPDPPPISHSPAHQQTARRGPRSAPQPCHRARPEVAAPSTEPTTAAAQPRPQPNRKRPRSKRVVQSDSSESEESSKSSAHDKSDSSDSSDEGARADAMSDTCAPADDVREDERPQIPQGFQRIEWSQGDDLLHFMVWTAVDRQLPSWHRGKVLKVLRNHTRYTHDVTLDESRQRRGIALDATGYNNGCWIALALQNTTNSSQLVEAQTSEASTSVERPPASVPTGTPSRVQSRRRVRTTFECSKCHKSNDTLYCPSDAPDGVAPPLCCIECAPRGWVSLSRTDYERACT